MIVVVGNPIARAAQLGGGVEGTPARAAIVAARAGADVQLVGKAGDDPLGDSILLSLAAAGVGHAAVLRDPSHPTPLAVPRSEEAAIPALGDDDAGALAIVPEDAADRPSLDAADVELALRYLPDHRAIVVAEPQPASVVSVVGEAASYAGSALVLVVAPGFAGPAPDGALVVESPASDPDGAFAGILGELAASLDGGVSPSDAFRTLRSRVLAAATE